MTCQASCSPIRYQTFLAQKIHWGDNQVIDSALGPQVIFRNENAVHMSHAHTQYTVYYIRQLQKLHIIMKWELMVEVDLVLTNLESYTQFEVTETSPVTIHSKVCQK